MGLGNQMFQYAAGRSLALQKQVPYKVNVSSYNGYSLRRFELENFFTLQVDKASPQEMQQFTLNNPVKQVWNKIFPGDKMRAFSLPYEERFIKRKALQLGELLQSAHPNKVYIEPAYHFNPGLCKVPANVLLAGYFMSWRYFQQYESVIRQDFTVRPELVAHLHDIAGQMCNHNSISLHIRRGDFADKKNLELHGIIPLSFYEKAVEHIIQKTGEAHVYIFSDDIAWVQNNWQGNNATTYVSDQITHNAAEDFYLLTQCRHNVIANSTFSWWAAYLNNYPDKIVVAPRKWYKVAVYNSKDVYPPAWVVF